MIVLDTHIWVWWVHDERRLTPEQVEAIIANEEGVIVATARIHNCPLVTSDGKLQKYPHVETIE